MKKAIVVTLLLILFQRNIIYAQEEITIIDNPSEIPNASASTEIKYDLPYPGMLPDNRLYFLKTLRDKIILFLISDQLKEAEFNILTSDKRLNAGLYLVENNKYDLAFDSISKSNNYYHEALNGLSAAKKEGKDIKHVTERMRTSVKKHGEILNGLVKQVPAKEKARFESENKRLQGFEPAVMKLLVK